MLQLKFILLSAAYYHVFQVCVCDPSSSPLASFRNLNLSRGSATFKDLPASVSNQNSSTSTHFRPNFALLRKTSFNTEQGNTINAPNLPNISIQPTAPSTRAKPIELEQLLSGVPETTYTNDQNTESDESNTRAEKRKPKRSSSRKDTADTNSTSDDQFEQSKESNRSSSKSNSKSKDPLYIKNREVLKKKAADLFQDLLKDANANKALTTLASNARKILQNEVGSEVILRHTRLITETLMNTDAEHIITRIRKNFTRSFIAPDAPATTDFLLDVALKYLANKKRPDSYNSKASFLNSVIDSQTIRDALEKFKNSFFALVEQPDIEDAIAKQVVMINDLLSWLPAE